VRRSDAAQRHTERDHRSNVVAFRKSGSRREFFQLQSDRPSPLGVGTAKDVSERSAVPYEIQKQGDSAYRLIPSRPLPPGEYTLSMPTNNVAYSFGIDGANKSLEALNLWKTRPKDGTQRSSKGYQSQTFARS
jgi:hypothetical protein